MANETPLLTFAIPTFNRPGSLSKLLAILLEQLQEETRVELIVSDNASPDETADVVSRYQASGLPIRYLRNHTNLGADRNILNCFEQSTGKYVWIFSDDDVIAPGTLDRVLRVLSSHVYDLVCIRAYFF
ncbi:MAG: glycosyltransferase family 2 protein, partial [Terracidiphilus sp.]